MAGKGKTHTSPSSVRTATKSLVGLQYVLAISDEVGLSHSWRKALGSLDIPKTPKPMIQNLDTESGAIIKLEMLTSD